MRYRRADELTWDLADDRVVILDARGSTLVTLNPVGSLLWLRLEEPSTLGELTERLREAFPEIEAEVLARDTQEFVDHLLAEELLVAAAERTG